MDPAPYDSALPLEQTYYETQPWMYDHQAQWQPEAASQCDEDTHAMCLVDGSGELQAWQSTIPFAPEIMLSITSFVQTHMFPQTQPSCAQTYHDLGDHATTKSSRQPSIDSASSRCPRKYSDVSSHVDMQSPSIISFASRSETKRSARRASQSNTAAGEKPPQQSLRCPVPGCHTKRVFGRECDLRKHIRRHMKKFACRIDGCPESLLPRFSDTNDRDRHEARHKPSIACGWKGCDRIFSRKDNMKDHVKRVHLLVQG